MIYDVGWWILAGQTPGKRIMGLLVVQTNGERLKLGRALLRWLGYWLSGILFLGFLWVLVDRRRQGFQDKLARSLVIYSRPGAVGLEPSTPIRDRLSNLRRQRGAAKTGIRGEDKLLIGIELIAADGSGAINLTRDPPGEQMLFW